VILDDFFLVSGWDECLRRLGKLSEEDLTYQSELIASSLSIRYPEAMQGEQSSPDMIHSWLAEPPLSDDELTAAALRIADEIADRVMMKNGVPTWLTRKFDPMIHLLNIGPTDAGLYEGTAGIGLFLAAASRVNNDARLRQLAIDCFQPIRTMLDTKDVKSVVPHLSLGYGAGFGGIVQAVWQTGELLDDDSLKALVEQLLSLPLEQAVANDQQHDVMAGCAGAILSLLPFTQQPSLPEALRTRLLTLAEQCGDHLLQSRFRFKNRQLWPCTYSDVPLTGFAHGAAGYACALLQLHQVTGRDDFKAAALDAIGYEQDVFVPAQHNWPDFRVHRDLPPGETAFMAGWCAGAPGVGLGRLLTLNVLDTPEIRADIEQAITFSLNLVRQPHPSESDHTCCGIAGRIDFLLEAAQRLNRPELHEAARASASFMIRRARHKGRFTFNGDTSGPVFSPGLFTGLAGVGQTLLRVGSDAGSAERLLGSSLAIHDNKCRAGARRSQSPHFSQRVWQREYWDRFIRDENHFNAVIDYIHNNPVNAKLVDCASKWPWSSAHED
jgi:type 2 lantibiotic biosynthesis protein LanM